MPFEKGVGITLVFAARNSSGALVPGVSDIATYLSKDGSAFAATSNSPTEIGSGFYQVQLTDQEMDYSVLALQWTGSGVQSDGFAIYTDSVYTSQRAAYLDRIVYIATVTGTVVSGDGTDASPMRITFSQSISDNSLIGQAIAFTSGNAFGIAKTVKSCTYISGTDSYIVFDRSLGTIPTAGDTCVVISSLSLYSDEIADAVIAEIVATTGSTTVTVSDSDLVDSNGNIEVVRDDNVSITFTDQTTDITTLSGYTIYFTVRDTDTSTSSDDSDAVFQVEATITDASNKIFKVEFGKSETTNCEVGRRYFYDIQYTKSDDIRTPQKGTFKVTGDVTRRTS